MNPVVVKACVCYFYQIFIFHQMIALQKLWKMLFISSKSSFRSEDNQIFLFPSFSLFLPLGHCFRGWSKINLRVYDAINCLNKKSITHFVCYLEKEKRWHENVVHWWSIYQIKNIFMEKSCWKYAAKTSPRPLYNFGK